MLPTPESLHFGLFLFSECKVYNFTGEKNNKKKKQHPPPPPKVSFALLSFKPPWWGRGRECDCHQESMGRPFLVSRMHDVPGSCSTPTRKASLQEPGGGQKKEPESIISSPPAPTPHPQPPLLLNPLIFPKKLSQAFPQTQTAIREILLPDGLFFP